MYSVSVKPDSVLPSFVTSSISCIISVILYIRLSLLFSCQHTSFLESKILLCHSFSLHHPSSTAFTLHLHLSLFIRRALSRLFPLTPFPDVSLSLFPFLLWSLLPKVNNLVYKMFGRVKNGIK